MTESEKLAWLLPALFGNQKVELHHRPALVNREKVYRYDHSKPGLGKVFCGYKPAANDRDFLVYVTKEEHGIETRVRGQGAQLSDLAIARKRKRAEKKKLDPPEATKAWFRKAKWKWRDIGGGLKAGPVGVQVAPLRDIMWGSWRPKRKWPKRKFPKRRRK